MLLRNSKKIIIPWSFLLAFSLLYSFNSLFKTNFDTSSATKSFVYGISAVFSVVMIMRYPRDIFSWDMLCFCISCLLAFFTIISAVFDYLISTMDILWLSPISVVRSRFLFYFVRFVVQTACYYILLRAIYTLFFSKHCLEQCDGYYVNTALKIRKSYLPSVFLFLSIFVILYYPNFPYHSHTDIINQWNQIHGELSFNRIHSIGHTVFLKALLSVYDDYSVVVIFQFLGLTGIYILFAYHFSHEGLSPEFTYLVCSAALIITLNVTNAYFCPWKDVPYSFCLASITLFIMRYLKRSNMQLMECIILGLSFAGCILFRLNGIIAFIGCGFYFIFSFIRHRHFKQLVILLACTASVLVSFNVYVDKLIKPLDLENGFSIQVFGSGIAAMVNSGELSEKELAEVEALVSTNWINDTYYNPAYKHRLIWASDNSDEINADENLEIFNNKFVLDLGKHKSEVIQLYFKLMPKHFMTCIADVLGSLRMMWYIPDTFLFSYPFIALMLIYLAIKSKLRGKDFLIFLPTACNTVSIMISTITSEIRYLLPTFMLMPVFFLYIVAFFRNNNESKPLNHYISLF